MTTAPTQYPGLVIQSAADLHAFLTRITKLPESDLATLLQQARRIEAAIEGWDVKPQPQLVTLLNVIASLSGGLLRQLETLGEHAESALKETEALERVGEARDAAGKVEGQVQSI